MTRACFNYMLSSSICVSDGKFVVFLILRSSGSIGWGVCLYVFFYSLWVMCLCSPYSLSVCLKHFIFLYLDLTIFTMPHRNTWQHHTLSHTHTHPYNKYSRVLEDSMIMRCSLFSRRADKIGAIENWPQWRKWRYVRSVGGLWATHTTSAAIT